MQYVVGGATILAGGLLYALSRPPPMSRTHTPRGDIHDVEGVDTHIATDGPPEGERVLMLHGFGSHSFVFDKVMDHLAHKGYRVATFDFQGFGHSDLPEGTKLDSEHYTQQVRQVVEALGWTEDSFTLIGFSLGGAVSMLYAASYPENVKSLVLVAPAGLPVPMPLKSYPLKLPYLGELITGSNLGPKLLHKRYLQMIRYDDTPQDVRDHLLHGNLYMAQAPTKKRYFEATLSTLRHFPLAHGIPEVVNDVGRHDRSILLCWGTADDVVPYTNATRFLDAMPSATLHSFDECGHLLHQEKPEEFHKRVESFLKSGK